MLLLGPIFTLTMRWPQARDYFKSCLQNPRRTLPVKQYHGVKKLEYVSLGELNNYVLESPPQTIEFLCRAKIASLEATNGWCYISCAKCSKKLQRGNSSFTCLTY
ncbi:hypothetical protein Bca52824_029397 [Brassica carinata]|uniref:Uncharacterized protein n=1 Tax=Brassica carinata TaxID=52824 RepID=A0A8X7VEG8_BRACI|nr:hypothetical protein Bca52824_029397 [Brassica carinata]